MKKTNLLATGLLFSCGLFAQTTTWPEVKTEAKPFTRWWWMGNAVDQQNLTYNLERYAKAGLGGVEITPIYGVKGNESRNLQYLSPQWMAQLRHTEAENKRLGMETDMNNGTGWPFGGPTVSVEDAATKVIFQEYKLKGGETLSDKIGVNDPKQVKFARLSRLMAFSADGKKLDITSNVKADGSLNWTAPQGEWRLIGLFIGKTLQMVKRAAPGGQGYVMDHFSKKAVDNYFKRFDDAFRSTKTAFPKAFFNDSYEVYDADWTPGLLEAFYKMHGYKLEMYLPEFLGGGNDETRARIFTDYRVTIAEMLHSNFTQNWTNWAHSHGALTRNQAHGSPGNLIDLYATVDIPECESFGISEFNIKGLRKDSLIKKNDSDLSTLKYASSAAHISGKPLTSSETLTWLTEHFRTSLSQCKPDIDLMFLGGVNHLFFHGTPYSPQDAAWPGWLFYASVNMSPTNTIWKDANAMFSYITRCQSYLQYGKPDNDFLLYLPIYDIWNEQRKTPYIAFSIHNLEKQAPKFIDMVHQITGSGYDVDYISDNFIKTTSCENGRLKTVGGSTYKAIIVPDVHLIPADVLAQLIKLAENGATVVFTGQYPEDAPGLANLEKRRTIFHTLAAKLPKPQSFGQVSILNYGKGRIITGSDYNQTLSACGVKAEEFKAVLGGKCIRRKNETGHHYFFSNLQGKDIDNWVTLGVDAQSAMLFDPMSGKSGLAKIRKQDGKTQVYLQLASGESTILKTFEKADVKAEPWNYFTADQVSLNIDKGWSLSFTESEPAIKGTFDIDRLCSWTELDNPNTKINAGSGKYSVTFDMPATGAKRWILDLGDVRESARVTINGQSIGTLWAVPYRAEISQYLRTGKNTLEVEVTNLPANRIADYDRRGIEWRKFEEINLVDIKYRKTKYGHWEPMPSGLIGPVRLIPGK